MDRVWSVPLAAGSAVRQAAATAGGATAATLAAGVEHTDSVQQTIFYNPATPHAAPIPPQALRLRVIANSNSPKDQAVKLSVRNAVVLSVAKLLSGVQTLSEAKQRVIAAEPQLLQTALAVVRANHESYPVSVDVGQVPFPTKLYGNLVYPAGVYEALRITLGAGQGQNWWCVLFPPLCFIDLADGDAVPNTNGFPDLPPLETISLPGPTGILQPVQVRLWTVDVGEEIVRGVQQWWQQHV
ncbi:stage II sporulation protein R [Alicyclobacillaceae bacterium I2511]|nr:stage II sporulation protein R [Alicyclobacillaceae bacterium I2511]